MEGKSVFETLNAVDISDKAETKNGLSYLSWAHAWRELKKLYPDANYIVHENADGWIYFTDGKTCWVKTTVTVDGISHTECLPVMNYRNESIPLEEVTSADVNKSIQRSLTKAIARHGLGLSLYVGEDLRDTQEQKKPKSSFKPSVKAEKQEENQTASYRNTISKTCAQHDIDLNKECAALGIEDFNTASFKELKDLLEIVRERSKKEA